MIAHLTYSSYLEYTDHDDCYLSLKCHLKYSTMIAFCLVVLLTLCSNITSTIACNGLHIHPMPLVSNHPVGRMPSPHPRHFSRPVAYYSNSTATRQILLLSGDIETDPGPTNQSARCANCEGSIRRDHRRSICSSCHEPLHLKCSMLPLKQLRLQDVPVSSSVCSQCAAKLLPFADASMSTNDTYFNDYDSSFKSESVNDNPSLLNSLA